MADHWLINLYFDVSSNVVIINNRLENRVPVIKLIEDTDNSKFKT